MTPLTPRELQVVDLWKRGLTAKGIGKELNISPRSVEQHIHHIIQKTETTSMRRAVILLGGGAALILLFLVAPVLAHDSWISRGGHRNAAGEWCCGEGDCFEVEPVRTTADGYLIMATGERVPFSEAMPSPDGKFWRCKRPDGSRRCFFAPPPSM